MICSLWTKKQVFFIDLLNHIIINQKLYKLIIITCYQILRWETVENGVDGEAGYEWNKKKCTIWDLIRMSKLNIQIGKGDWICIILTLIILQTLFLWCVDMSTSAIINNGIVTNGFIINDPVKTFHIGLYGALLIPIAISFILVHHIMSRNELKN